ncbi:MAG TPA: cellulose synthase subunit BcsC-related outer membrane protein [Acidisarcina sp.]
MFRIRPALTLSILTLAACSSAVYAQQKPLQVLIDRAQLLDTQGRHDLAAEHWRQVLLIEPRQPAGLAALAAYYKATGDQAKTQYYERLLSTVQPSGTAPGLAFGAASGGLGTARSNDARLDQVSRLNAQHQYAAALEILRQVFGTTPPDNWGVTYYQTEAALPSERAQGIAGLRGLVAKYPANPGYQLALGKTLTYAPDTRAQGMRLLADFSGTPAQNEEARAAWKAAILWDPSAPAAVASSKQYLERYPDADLGSQINTAEKKAPAVLGPSAAEKAGYRALAGGDLSDAESSFTSMTAEPAQAAQGEAGLGYVDMQRKDFTAAESHFEKARAKGLRSAELEKALHEARYWAVMSKGNEALQSKDPEQAAADFARARETDPKRPEAAEALGGSLLAQQDPEQAAGIFSTDVKNNPGRPDAWLGWMNALLESGQTDRVLAIQKDIPADVRAQLLHRADYLALLLCATRAQGNDSDSRMLLDRLLKVDGPAEGGAGAKGSTEADNGIARAAALLFRYSYFDDASRLCVSALKRDSSHAETWQILVQSEHMAGRDRNAIAISTRMPHSVNVATMSNAGFLLTLATAYQGDQQFSKAQALLDQARTLSGTGPGNVAALQMQQASLSMAEGKSDLAYQQYQQITKESPEELDAWTGMFNALHAGNHDAQALTAMGDIPDSVGSKLRHDASFLQTAGFVYSGTGHRREALLCLRAVTEHYEQQHQPVPFGAAVGIAWLELNAGNERELAASLDRLGRQRNLSVSQTLEVGRVWAAWSMRRAEASYTSGDHRHALSILETAVRAYPGDTTLKTSLAGMYIRTGDTSDGMKLYTSMDWTQASVDQFTAGIGAALTSHSMSYAEYWLHLGLERFPDNPALLRAGAHVEESKGNLKSAENYLKLALGHGTQESEGSLASTAVDATDSTPLESGDSTTSVSPADELAHMLTGSTSVTPIRSAIRGTDASSVTAFRNAPAVYTPQAWNGGQKPANVQEVAFHDDQDGSVSTGSTAKGATKQDRASHMRRSAPGAAENNRASDTSSQDVADPLHGVDLGLTGHRASDQQHSYREPLPERSANQYQAQSAAQSRDASTTSLSALLDSAEDSSQGRGEVASTASGSALEEQLLSTEPTQPEAPLDSDGGRVSGPNGSSLRSRNTTAPAATATDELAILQAEYSPLFIGGGQAESHSGTLGFDRLQQFEADAVASRVLGLGTARLSVITRPILLQSGIPDATSNYRFGSGSTLPTDAQFASGTGASVQLATRDVEASVGFSPSGFLVRNVLGTVSVRPAHGPVTLSAYRMSEKDSLLSYAGIRDPATGLAWGGVVASGGSIQFAHGGAASGFYGSLDAQRLTGQRVLDNTRVMGNAGAYWVAMSNPYGDLKIGANLTAMHYAMNQRYFTVGQGGYFSPNAFLLMNAPINWEGRPIYNTSYSIGGSMGVQSIQQGAALAGSLVTGTGVETTNGASYDLHGRVAHRMDAHWTLEGFFATNNARDYTDNSAGFTVRYSVNPLPLEFAPGGFTNLAEPLPIQAP